MNRREMLITSAGLLSTAVVGRTSQAAAIRDLPFTMDLCPGRIGVQASQAETIQLAGEFGFTSVQPFAETVGLASDTEREAFRQMLKERNLVWGAADLPVPLNRDEESFQAAIARLPDIARGLQKAGVTRISTWLDPRHASLTYRANFDRHVRWIREIATIFKEHDMRLGLEYVGTKTLWTQQKYPFIHTMAESKELFDAVGTGNVGFVLDSWHWTMAEESVSDVRSLSNEEIVAVDLNDAPGGIPLDQQLDGRRGLPASTGVIDLRGFLQALVDINYDGPVRAEPFDQQLNAMDDEIAVEKTAAAMKKAFSLLG